MQKGHINEVLLSNDRSLFHTQEDKIRALDMQLLYQTILVPLNALFLHENPQVSYPGYFFGRIVARERPPISSTSDFLPGLAGTHKADHRHRVPGGGDRRWGR